MRGLDEVSAAAALLHRRKLRPGIGICVHGTGTGPDLGERKPRLGNVGTWLWKRGSSPHFSWGTRVSVLGWEYQWAYGVGLNLNRMSHIQDLAHHKTV